MAAYDISTFTFIQIVLDVSGQMDAPRDMLYNDNGTKLYVVSNQEKAIFEYALSSAYDVSTGSFTRIALDVSGQEDDPIDMLFNDDGTKLYVIGQTGDDINEYALSSAYDIFTGSFTRIALSVSGQETGPTDMMFNNDGTKLYVTGYSGDDINEYAMTVPTTFIPSVRIF